MGRRAATLWLCVAIGCGGRADDRGIWVEPEHQTCPQASECTFVESCSGCYAYAVNKEHASKYAINRKKCPEKGPACTSCALEVSCDAGTCAVQCSDSSR